MVEGPTARVMRAVGPRLAARLGRRAAPAASPRGLLPAVSLVLVGRSRTAPAVLERLHRTAGHEPVDAQVVASWVGAPPVVRGDVVCVLEEGVEPAPAGWLGQLLGAFVDDDVAAAGPLLVRPGRLGLPWPVGRPVAGLAFDVDRWGVPQAALRLERFGDVAARVQAVPALPDGCLVLARPLFEAVWGEGGATAAVWCRLHAEGRRAVVVRSVVAVDVRAGGRPLRPVPARSLPAVTAAVERDLLLGGCQLAASPARAAIVAPADHVRARELAGALSSIGWKASVERSVPRDADVVVLVHAGAPIPVPSPTTTVAAWAGRPDDWLGSDELAAVDLVIVDDEPAASAVRDAAGQWTIAAGGSPIGVATALRDALLERSARPSFVLDIAAPNRKVSPRWGDLYLAEALARSLRARGHRVLIQTADEWERPAGRARDVCIQLKGFGRVRRSSGQVHVIWNISHPEELSAEECDDADLVLVASERFAEHLRSLTTTPVGVLLQATDHRRFRPVPPVPEYRHDVAFVGKTRDVFRPVVRDALAGGLRPAIYGSGWGAFVDAGLVRAEFVPNAELPKLYSSVSVLLNDHWESMRDWGFVSNRLFDALACGATVVSDHLPELEGLFAGAVATYREPDDLRRRVEELLASADERYERAERGSSAVSASHTFDTRAEELLGAIEPLIGRRDSGSSTS